MAHKFSVRSVPHVNKDGSESASKKDWQVWDRTRGKVVLVGVGTSQVAAQNLATDARNAVVSNHLKKHPNDSAFKNKHGIKE